jgi:hypothetical protein
MEKFEYAKEDSEVRKTQVQRIEEGMKSLHPEEPSLSEDDLQALRDGGYDGLTIKQQYWVGKYFTEGMRLKKAEAAGINKVLSRPATIGDVSRITHEFVYGQGGLAHNLSEQIAYLQRYSAILTEALSMKGLLTEENISEAAASLEERAKAVEENQKYLAEAAKKAEALKEAGIPVEEPAIVTP